MSVNRTGNKSQTGGADWDAKTGSAVDIDSLNALFGSPSLASDNRNLPEVEEVKKLLVEGYLSMTESTIPGAQRAIIPKVELISPVISSTLPGLVMFREIGDQIWAMSVLFATAENCNSTDSVIMQNPGGMPQRVTSPIPPSAYFNKEVVEQLERHFKSVSEGLGLKGVPQLICLTIADYEMVNHPLAGELKERPARLANWLKGMWESAILTKVATVIASQGKALPSPFKEPTTPYGKDNWAEARVIAIDNRVSKGGTLLPSNMEVLVSTSNNPNNNSNNNSNQSNSKPISRCTATVQLSAVPYNAHMENVTRLSQAGNQSEALASLMGVNGGLYPNGYKPFHPVITLDTAQGEEMMNSNNGLYPWYFSLYALMCTNADYIFTEAFRRANVGARGNLSALEPRLEILLNGVFAGARPVMDDKSVLDTDAVNAWIRTNVAPHCVFRSNIIPHGLDAPLNKHLEKLSDPLPVNRAGAVATLVAVMNGLSKNKFGELLERNKQLVLSNPNTRCWTVDKPALHRTKMIAVNGLAKNLEGKFLNTLEVDEMYLGKHKGKAGMKANLDYLTIMYGTNGEEIRARSQRLKLEQQQSLFDGHVHINAYGMSCVWDPYLMALIAESMQEVGTMNVANTMATLRPNNAVFMPNGGLQTMAVVGTSSANNLMGAFGGGSLWG